jgi:hypothetical protein
MPGVQDYGPRRSGTSEPATHKGSTMSRYERNQFFDAIYRLREGYSSSSSDDRRVTLSIDDAILYAEAVMGALEIEREEADVAAEMATVDGSTVAGEAD